MLRIRRYGINMSTSANISASSTFPSKAHAIIPNMWQPNSLELLQGSMASAPSPALQQYTAHAKTEQKWSTTSKRRHTCARCCHVGCLAALRSPRARSHTQTESKHLARKADLDKLQRLLAIARRNGFATEFQVNPGHTGDNGLFLAKNTRVVHDNSKRYMEI